MRYDKQIYFCTRGSSEYDSSTGDYTVADPTKVGVMAAVNSTRAELLTLAYGSLKQGTFEVSLQNAYKAAFDYIEIDGTPYKVDFERTLRHKQTYVVSEVQ